MGLSIAEVNASLNALATSPKGATPLPNTVLEEAKKKAMRKLAQLIDLPALQTSATITLVVDTVAYALPIPAGSELDRIRVVNYDSGEGTEINLLEVDDRELEIARRVEKSEGHPDRYAVWGNQIKVYPIPDFAGTLYSDLLKKITAITEIEDEYFSLYIDLCKLEIYEEASPKWIGVQREVQRQLEERKHQVEPYKSGFERTGYRNLQIKDINQL